MATYVPSTTTAVRSHYGWLDGLIGGLIAGIVQGMVGMMGTLVMGQGLFWPLVLIGYAFQPLAENPSQDVGHIMLGLVVHMVFTMMLGLMFALIAGYLPRALPLVVWGVIFGVAIWVIDQLGAEYATDPTLAVKMNQILFLVTHIVYGAVLGWWVASRGNKTATA